MNKNYSISIYIILISFSSIFSELAYGQIKIKWEEVPNLAQKIIAEVPEGKALLVFEGKEDFTFDSDVENITQPIKDGLLYKLLIDIEPFSGAITIKHSGADNSFINYGRTLNSTSLPALKSKEIKYFRLNLTTPLVSYDITRKMKGEGISEFQAKYDKEAMVIFYVAPQNLELIIEGSEITETIHEEGRYKIYTKPVAQKVILKSKKYDNTPIDFEDLGMKEVRYYHVEIPQLNVDVESFDPNIEVGNYSIESSPTGALIQMTGNPDFNKGEYKTPYPLKGYKTGTFIITLTLDDYETITDTILISSTRGKKSKYTFEPKFAYINCNIEPSIPFSKVSMDGKELISIENEKDYKCLKGTHNIEISAPHYYSDIRQISLAAGTINEVNIKLRPKMGSLSILSGINSSGAEIIINNNKVGEIPTTKDLALQEGRYELRFNKPGFLSEKPVYIIEVLENKLTKFNDLKMITSRKVQIISSPENGATVYIDSVLQSDKTNLYVSLAIGDHSIKIEREHYKPYEKTITVDNEHDVFNFRLEELSYSVSFVSKPSSSNIIIDGELSGKTPNNIKLQLGSHKVTIENHGYLKKTRTIFVKEQFSFKTKLFPSSYLVFGVDYGLGQYGPNVGYVIKGVLLSFGVRTNINNNITTNNISINNVTIQDIDLYDKEDARIYGAKSLSFNAKLGFTIKKPFIFLLTAGCSYIQTDKFQKVFSAKHDYIGENTDEIIIKGDLFSVPYLYLKTYTVLTAGIMVPITNWIYCSADYNSNSDLGPGVSFGLGFMLRKR